jgi:hypothetical protein
LDKHRVGIRISARGGVVVARSFVSQCPVDHNKVRGRSCGLDLACRGKAYEELATGGKQLFGNQDSKRCPDDPADDAHVAPGERECVQFRMVAGPRLETSAEAALTKLPDEIAVRV